MEFYKQCKLKKGTRIQTSWIPERGAKKGNIVELKSDGYKETGWEVAEVYSRISGKALQEQNSMHRVHRHGSDV